MHNLISPKITKGLDAHGLQVLIKYLINISEEWIIVLEMPCLLINQIPLYLLDSIKPLIHLFVIELISIEWVYRFECAAFLLALRLNVLEHWFVVPDALRSFHVHMPVYLDGGVLGLFIGYTGLVLETRLVLVLILRLGLILGLASLVMEISKILILAWRLGLVLGLASMIMETC